MPNSRTNLTNLMSDQPIENPLTDKRKKEVMIAYIKEGTAAMAPNYNSSPNPPISPKQPETPNPDPPVVVNISPVELDTLRSGDNKPNHHHNLE